MLHLLLTCAGTPRHVTSRHVTHDAASVKQTSLALYHCEQRRNCLIFFCLSSDAGKTRSFTVGGTRCDFVSRQSSFLIQRGVWCVGGGGTRRFGLGKGHERASSLPWGLYNRAFGGGGVRKEHPTSTPTLNQDNRVHPGAALVPSAPWRPYVGVRRKI